MAACLERPRSVLIFGPPYHGLERLAGVAIKSFETPALLLPPCPCGWFTCVGRPCSCDSAGIEAWLARHRDLLETSIVTAIGYALPTRYMLDKPNRNELEGDLVKVAAARTQPLLPPKLEGSAEDLFRRACGELGLTLVGRENIIRVAQAVARLERHNTIEIADVAEALHYRPAQYRGIV